MSKLVDVVDKVFFLILGITVPTYVPVYRYRHIYHYIGTGICISMSVQATGICNCTEWVLIEKKRAYI